MSDDGMGNVNKLAGFIESDNSLYYDDKGIGLSNWVRDTPHHTLPSRILSLFIDETRLVDVYLVGTHRELVKQTVDPAEVDDDVLDDLSTPSSYFSLFKRWVNDCGKRQNLQDRLFIMVGVWVVTGTPGELYAVTGIALLSILDAWYCAELSPYIKRMNKHD